jgi:hypothetical protein
MSWVCVSNLPVLVAAVAHGAGEEDAACRAPSTRSMRVCRRWRCPGGEETRRAPRRRRCLAVASVPFELLPHLSLHPPVRLLLSASRRPSWSIVLHLNQKRSREPTWHTGVCLSGRSSARGSSRAPAHAAMLQPRKGPLWNGSGLLGCMRVTRAVSSRFEQSGARAAHQVASEWVLRVRLKPSSSQRSGLQRPRDSSPAHVQSVGLCTLPARAACGPRTWARGTPMRRLLTHK